MKSESTLEPVIESGEAAHAAKRAAFMASLPPSKRAGFAYLNSIIDRLYAPPEAFNPHKRRVRKARSA